MDLHINIQKLTQEIDTLASFSQTPAPAVTRVLFSDEDMSARAYIIDLMREADLSVREDAIGNIFARWHGSEANLPAVATGSHTDAIPYSGKFDGTVGVLGGLEAIRSLQEAGFQPLRSIELIMFTAEEPTRFGLGCLGSRLMAGTLNKQAIQALQDSEGQTLADLRESLNLKGSLDEVTLPKDYYHSFVELHIEQGPVLEQTKRDIGLVTAIAAPASLNILIKAQGGHAGTVLMADRKDALLAGAEIALLAEEITRSSGNEDSVATVGIFDIYPRAINSIPSEVFLTVDLRDTDLTRRDLLLQEIIRSTELIAKNRSVDISVDTVNLDPPATCSSWILDAIESSVQELQYKGHNMVSRAYHDALFMAKLCPMGMIFVPSQHGISHKPEEFTKASDIKKGVNVLAHTLSKLSYDEDLE